MARDNNFLLGFGESLVTEVSIDRGGGPKTPPYDYGTARQRAADGFSATASEFRDFPRAACPDDQVVAKVTIHPRYVSMSDFPIDLFQALSLTPLGSRSALVRPENWGIGRHPVEAVSEQVFVMGSRTNFEEWALHLPEWASTSKPARQLLHVEGIAPFRAVEKVKDIPEGDLALLEVVLHNRGRAVTVAEAFSKYAQALGADVKVDKRRDVRGLTFMPVVAPPGLAPKLAEFSLVRAARGMPSIRPVPNFLRSGRVSVTIPDLAAVAPDIRVAVFDGGLPKGHGLGQWVNEVVPSGVGAAPAGYSQHGLAVTGALLFGPIDATSPLPQPLCAIDHFQVLDGKTGYDALDALDRITEGLDASGCEFANISIGPNHPVVDDDVTRWTAELDIRAAGGDRIIAVAVGNDGEADSTLELNRIQPPADGVNVLSVGACDRSGVRAPYSCVGPGRSPGLVKPEGVAFGGVSGDPFTVLGVGGSTLGVEGTSFATPFVLKSAVSVKAQLGGQLRPLAIRALLLHRASGADDAGVDVGWGQFETSPDRLITCDDDEALVVFQGTLPPGKHLRAPIPVPDDPLTGNVIITATLVIAPDVDPEYPGAYTRTGLDVSFRPNASRVRIYPDGTVASQAKTRAFFSQRNLYAAPEYELRSDGHKWESCRKASVRVRASSLDKPFFDIKYVHRNQAVPGEPRGAIPYALIISVKVPAVPTLYNKVVRAYSSVLVPLRPRLRLPVRV